MNSFFLFSFFVPIIGMVQSILYNIIVSVFQASYAWKKKLNLPIPLSGPNWGDGQIFLVRVRFFSSQESASSSVSEQTVRILSAGEKKNILAGSKKRSAGAKNSENTTHKKIITAYLP